MSFNTLGFEIYDNPSNEFYEKISLYDQEKEKLNKISSKIRTKWKNKDNKVKQFVDIHRYSDFFKDIIFSKEVNTIISNIFGSTPCFVNHSKISFKNSSSQVWFPHQDGAYKSSKDTKGVTVCVFLDNIKEDQGPIVCLEKSQLDGIIDHKIVFAEDETEPQIQTTIKKKYVHRSITGNKGTILAMDFKLIHYSKNNLTSSNRPIFIFEVEEIKKHPLEYDGRDAITFYYKPSGIIFFRRAYMFTRNILVFPLLKKLMYILYRYGLFKDKKNV